MLNIILRCIVVYQTERQGHPRRCLRKKKKKSPAYQYVTRR